MKSFQLPSLLDQMSAERRAYLEFLRVPALSLGVYRLGAGDVDQQQPHTEDEAYYVLAGRAKFTCDGQVQFVSAGIVLFVERNVEHRFFEIEQEPTVLVFFAPAEHSLGDARR
jgi:mannose-6-phosphate isomerase-like protein (cupin superfamily)